MSKLKLLLPLLGVLLASCSTLGLGTTKEMVYVVEASGGA